MLSPFLGGLKQTIRTQKLAHHILRGVSALAVGMLVVTAMSQGLPLATMYTILFLSPFLITIVAIPVYKEKVTLKNWIIIAIGFFGIIVAFHDGLGVFSTEVMYIFCALFFIVIIGILARPLTEPETLLSLSFYPSISTALITFLLLYPDLSLPNTADIPIFLLNSIFAIIGLSGIAYGYRIAPYAVIAPVHYIQMVLALILGYVVFNDVPDFWMMVGAVIIIISGIMLIAHEKS